MNSCASKTPSIRNFTLLLCLLYGVMETVVTITFGCNYWMAFLLVAGVDIVIFSSNSCFNSNEIVATLTAVDVIPHAVGLFLYFNVARSFHVLIKTLKAYTIQTLLLLCILFFDFSLFTSACIVSKSPQTHSKQT